MAAVGRYRAEQGLLPFEDILQVNDRGIQALLRQIAQQQLALALKGAAQELLDRFRKNMSLRAWEMLAEEMAYLGPVRVGDVEQARQQIMSVVNRLNTSGDLVVGPFVE